jgi:hypothetical protein
MHPQWRGCKDGKNVWSLCCTRDEAAKMAVAATQFRAPNEARQLSSHTPRESISCLFMLHASASPVEDKLPSVIVVRM